MRRIVFAGDSHTVGQGAEGYGSHDAVPRVPGDLRLTGLSVLSFVGLYRQDQCRRSGAGWAEEYFSSPKLSMEGKRVSPASPSPYGGEQPCRWISPGQTLSIPLRGQWFRLQIKAGSGCGRCAVAVNGEKQCVVHTDSARPGRPYVLVYLDVPGSGEEEHTISLSPVAGWTGFYKLEGYRGDTAVINAGVGSCTSARYLSDFWSDYVAGCRPDIVVIEPFTINDWLHILPEESYRNIRIMIENTRAMGARPVVLTVSPILGNQINDKGISYGEYLAAASRAACDSGAVVADAHGLIARHISRSQDGGRHLYSDAWHMNDEGYELYFQALKAL